MLTILSIRVVRDDDLKRKQVAKANLESLGGSEEKPVKKPVKNAAEKKMAKTLDAEIKKVMK